MHSSILQAGGQHSINHQREHPFPPSPCYLRPFAEQSLVIQHVFVHLERGTAGCTGVLKLKPHRLSLWRSRLRDAAVLVLAKQPRDVNSRANPRGDLV